MIAVLLESVVEVVSHLKMLVHALVDLDTHQRLEFTLVNHLDGIALKHRLVRTQKPLELLSSPDDEHFLDGLSLYRAEGPLLSLRHGDPRH